MNLTKLWCIINGGFIEDNCKFLPSQDNSTVNRINYITTDKGYNLRGWLAPRIISNLAIGRDILQGERINNFTSFNLAQTDYCGFVGMGNCSTCSDNQYCYNNHCYTKHFPVSILSQNNTNSNYENIEVDLEDNILTRNIYNFTNYYYYVIFALDRIWI